VFFLLKNSAWSEASVYMKNKTPTGGSLSTVGSDFM